MKNYGKAYSIIGFLTNLGSSSSLTLIGYVYDFTGNYNAVMKIAIGMHLFNLLILLIAYMSSKKII